MDIRQTDPSQIVAAAMDLGEHMLICGSEVGRVESTLERLCAAYGAERTDVLVITESIILTTRSKQWGVLTQTRRINAQKYDLSQLGKLNELSRRVCAEPIPPEELKEQVRQITEAPVGRLSVSVLVWALTSGAFCAFFGGSVLDVVWSAVLGVILRLTDFVLAEKIPLNRYFSVIACSFIGGLLAGLPVRLGLPLNAATVSIGNIMLLIPGVAMTNSLRDLFGGDTISGLLKFCESTILSLVIAGGFALTTTASVLPESVQPVIWITAAFFSAGGLGLWFHVDLRTVLPGAAVGAAAWALVLQAQMMGFREFFMYLPAAAFVGLAAEVLSRVMKCPATAFLVMGIIPMVPGGTLYQTMRAALAKDWELFMTHGLRTLVIALAIAAGMFCVRAIFDAHTAMRGRE